MDTLPRKVWLTEVEVEVERERERERERESTSFCIGATPKRGNSYPGSRHVEPDVQVTLRTL